MRMKAFSALARSGISAASRAKTAKLVRNKRATVAHGCDLGLSSVTLADKDKEIYCNSCYGKRFGPKGELLSAELHAF